MADDPAAVLERWTDSGAQYSVLHIDERRAVVELKTCMGEPVERLESGDPELLKFLRRAG